MTAQVRRDQLLEMVRIRGFASLPDLADELRVSESTIRRDLDQLEQTGSAKRTHGGVFYTGPSPRVPHFDSWQQEQWGKKKAIAAASAQLIEAGDTILLDGGSTTYELARLLVGRSLQVVTNSLPVANLFMSDNETDLILIGGYVHARTGVVLGPYADRMLQELSVRRAVLSVAAVNKRGCYNSNLLLVETERAMMRAADETIVVADSAKFGHQSLAHLCDFEAVDRMVVDAELDQAWRDRLVGAGVELLLAPDVESSARKDLA